METSSTCEAPANLPRLPIYDPLMLKPCPIKRSLVGHGVVGTIATEIGMLSSVTWL